MFVLIFNPSRLKFWNMETCRISENFTKEKLMDEPILKKPGKGFPVINNLGDLIDALHVVFEDDHVNIEYVKELMLSYKSNDADWKKYAKFDRNRWFFYIFFFNLLIYYQKGKEFELLIIVLPWMGVSIYHMYKKIGQVFVQKNGFV